MYGKGIRIRPKIVRTPSEAVEYGPYDYVIVCTKALPEAKTAETIAPAVTEGTTCIVLIQNGIGIEDEYAVRFPSNPLVSCVVYLPTTQVEPGRIEMANFELLEIGTFPASAYSSHNHIKEAADTLLAKLKEGGSNVTFYPDIQEKRWNKLLLNASWNPICALTLSRDVAFLASSAAGEKLVSDVMQEVVAISQALGYTAITPTMAEDQMTRATDRKGGKGIEPSMLVDVLNGRRMEVEFILGGPVKVAKSLGVDVPRMETLYALSKALDEATALRQPGKSLAGDEVVKHEQKPKLAEDGKNAAFRGHLERFQYSSSNTNAEGTSTTPRGVTRKRLLVDNGYDTKSATSPAPAEKRRQSSRYAPPSTYAHLPKLTDILEPNLICIFVGTNPGIRTATAGHAYAHPSNLFWKLLHSSGCTDVRLRPEDDVNLPLWYAMGNTNIVERPSKDASQLSKTEMAAGTPILEEKVRRYRPEAVCIVGKGIWEAVWRWRYKREIKKGEWKYGWQDDKERMGREEGSEWEGALVYVTTSTSGLSASTRPAEKEEVWRPFGEWVCGRRQERFGSEGRLVEDIVVSQVVSAVVEDDKAVA
ncbi:uracil DNA N-glycosylase Thp1 [Friedmanniomyces endolithicus]|nr:uracil DNA N-glycosylase Thp1 [Friedmanniomyces endolithicus]